jgi:membrane protein
MIASVNLRTPTAASWRQVLEDLPVTLRNWPWFETIRTLRLRFRDDHLGLTASSLTFTTTIALVPLLTVMLALFTAFPVFGNFRDALQQYLLQNLVPDSIAKPVLGTLTQFAGKASRLGGVGLLALIFTAMALMLTIDRTLNSVWRVPKPRPIAQRVLVYWAALTLGPLALGVSLSLTSLALSSSRGLIKALPGGVSLVLDTAQFLLLAAAITGLYRYVPNTHVRWRHALAGGVFVAAGFEGAKVLLAWYLNAVPGLSMIYGAFATVPILLLWIYLGWVIVLLGAVVAAYAPSLQMRVVRQHNLPGQRFSLSLVLLRELAMAKARGQGGRSLAQLAGTLRTDPLQIEPEIETLRGLGWLGTLDEAGEQRHVLLCEPDTTLAQPLLQALLLHPHVWSAGFRRHARLDTMMLTPLLDLELETAA